MRRPALGLADEAHAADLPERPDIEGAQFARAIDLDQHREPAGRGGGRDHAGALGQGDDVVIADTDADATLIENPIADDGDHRRDGEDRRDRRDHHHDAGAGDELSAGGLGAFAGG